MKKFLVVLTILVLVAGFAFATVTGSVEARYVFDFSEGAPKTLTYGVWGTRSKIAFTLSTDKGGVDGTNKPYAVVAVALELSSPTAKADSTGAYLTHNAAKAVYTYNLGVAEWDLTVSLKLTEFKIVGENWEVDFMNAIGVGDYAKSAWEIDGNPSKADRVAIDAPWDFDAEEGVTVTYDGYKVGVHAERKATDLKLVANVRAESKEFTLAENVTGQAAIAVGASKNAGDSMAFDFGASVKAAYATDDLTVNGAVDLQNYAKKFDADVAVKVAVDKVTVDAYYATSLQIDRLHNMILLEDVKNILSVRAVVAAVENTTITVIAEDIANADRLLAVKEEGTYGKVTEDAQFGIYPSLKDVDIFKIFGLKFKSIWFANAGASYKVQENLSVNAHVGYMSMNGEVVILDGEKFHDSDLVFKVGAEYKLEKVTVSADAYVGKSFAKYGDREDNSDLMFGCELVAKSETLVENAVLSATLHIDKKGVIGLYDNTLVDAYAADPVIDDPEMSFTVGCKVTF
jgi:hypothetical protein